MNILGTSKKYQHQGAATLQVKEFNRIADELNAFVRDLLPSWWRLKHAKGSDSQITTESTTGARWLYEKNGYIVSENPGHWWIEAKSKEFSGRRKEKLFFMERPRGK